CLGCRRVLVLLRSARGPRRDARRRNRARADPLRAGRRADRRRGGRVARRLDAGMSPGWASVFGGGAATIVLKATARVLLGPRALPSWLAGPVSLLAPAVLAAFVVT